MKHKNDDALPADRIENTPEWKAAFGLIDGDEYLRLTAHYRPDGLHTDSYKAKRAALTERVRKKRAMAKQG